MMAIYHSINKRLGYPITRHLLGRFQTPIPIPMLLFTSALEDLQVSAAHTI